MQPSQSAVRAAPSNANRMPSARRQRPRRRSSPQARLPRARRAPSTATNSCIKRVPNRVPRLLPEASAACGGELEEFPSEDFLLYLDASDTLVQRSGPAAQ